MTSVLLARLAMARGEEQGALGQMRIALEKLKAHASALDQGRAMVHAAWIAARAGLRQEADGLLLGARDRFEAIHAKHELEFVREELARQT